MLGIARSKSDRRDLFRATAEAMRVHEAIVEKDFWVCWTLDFLFRESPWRDRLAFKGGTSLSKAYGVIERFSEDIDLVLHWEELGFASVNSDSDPWAARTPSKQDAFGKMANRLTHEFIVRTLAPALETSLSERAGASVAIDVTESRPDNPIAVVRYPRESDVAAILPEIRLEIGPLASWTPNELREIRPYGAERFPQVFERPGTTVRAISVERTFWEKATILHQEAHRPPDSPQPSRHSRHYYDLHRLFRSEAIRERALAAPELLGDVVEFKSKFYRSRWSSYETARFGTLHLSPPDARIEALRRDYDGMKAMLFGTIPSFEEILHDLAALERAVNASHEDPGLVSSPGQPRT